jgi:hypothetical protein
MISFRNTQLTKTTSTLQSKPNILISMQFHFHEWKRMTLTSTLNTHQGKETRSGEDMQNELPLQSSGRTGGKNHMVLLMFKYF